MKKAIAVLMVIAATGAYANNSDYGHKNGKDLGKHMEKLTASLSESQKDEFDSMKADQRKDLKSFKISMQEVELKIKKELLKDKPSKETLGKLAEDQADIYESMKKDMLEFRVDIKEKFGIDLPTKDGHRGKKK